MRLPNEERRIFFAALDRDIKKFCEEIGAKNKEIARDKIDLVLGELRPKDGDKVVLFEVIGMFTVKESKGVEVIEIDIDIDIEKELERRKRKCPK